MFYCVSLKRQIKDDSVPDMDINTHRFLTITLHCPLIISHAQPMSELGLMILIFFRVSKMAVVHYPPNSREIQSIKKSSELNWSANISLCLQSRGVAAARDCQAVSWPALSENNSTAIICVAGAQQGKTSGETLKILQN